MNKAKRIRYSELPIEELEKLAAPFEGREIDISEFKPLTPQMRREDAIARRKKPGRPMIGKGAKRILLSMESGLLSRVDQHTRKYNLTRAAFIASAVRAQLKKSA